MKRFTLCIVYLLVGQCLFAQTADLVLYNGIIITLQKPGHRVSAIAIKGEQIIATGTNESIRKYITKNTKN